MRFLGLLITVTAGFLVMAEGPCAEVISRIYRFEEPTVKQMGVYDEISIAGTRNLGTLGEPLLPVKGVELLLPPGQCVENVEVIPGERIVLPGSFDIRPSEREYPFSSEEPFVPTPRNAEVYSSEEPYPGRLYRNCSTQSLCGYNVAILAIHPVEYIPVKGEVAYYLSMEVRITTTTSERSTNATAGFLRTTAKMQARVERLVDNEEDILLYGIENVTKDEEFDYVIITNEGLSSSFEVLKNFKLHQGIKTRIKTVEEIFNEYSGLDNQDKIRNFIIDAYQNWNTEYVLLGGDDNTIPHRGLHAVAYGEVDSDIPADIYYGALDGNWNDDGDYYWGEPGEEDLLTEVFVGRAAVETTTEANNFINKMIMYQRNPVVDECTEALMAGELLWYDPTWGGDYKDEIKNGCDLWGYTTVGFPDWFNVETLYDRDLPYEWSAMTDLLPLLNSGLSIVNHLGHAWIDYAMRFYDYQVTDGNFTNDGTNHNFYIIYTQGCNCNAFDYEAISEDFTGIENGAVAFIGNTRYGWGRHQSTNGSSQYFDRQFFDALFGENIYNIGETNDDSKADNVWAVDSGAVRWCYYELCLIGDPQMPIWTETPRDLTVDHSPVCLIGSNQFEVTVPGVGGALVGLVKDGELLGRGYTDATGIAIVFFDIIPLTPGEMDVTVTNHNCLPCESVAELIIPECPYVIYDSHEIDDSQGNNNGRVNPGETIAMSLTLRNVGIETASNVAATLSTAHSFVTITDSVKFFGDIDSSGYGTSTGEYVFEVAVSCPDKHPIAFDLRTTADGGLEWNSLFTVEVFTPEIATSNDSVDFGEVYIGYPESLALAIFNLGSDTLNVVDIYSNSSEFSVDTASFSLAGGESQDVIIACSPDSSGMCTGTLHIISNDPNEEDLAVELIGEGVIAPDISVSDSLSDSLHTGETSTQMLTIFNTGGSDLVFDITIEEGSNPQIRRMKKKSGGFLKTHTGSGLDDVLSDRPYDFGHTAARKRTNPGEPELRNEVLNHLEVLLLTGRGDPSEIQALLLSFPGISVVDVFDASATTPTFEDLAQYHSVVVMNNYPFYNSTGLGNVLADYVDAGGGVVLTLACFVSGYEIRGRFLTEGFMPFDIGFGPVGSANLGDFSGNHPIMEGVTTVFGDLLADVAVATGADSIAEWDNGLPFVAAKGSSVAAMNIYVANSGCWAGDIPLILRNAIFWTEEAIQWLSLDTSSGVIPESSSVDIEVIFDAAGLYGGGYDANIVISSNDPDEREVTIPVHLNVTGAPDISLSDSLLDYGSVFVGASAAHTLTVFNRGTDVLTVYGIFSDVLDYTADTTSFTLSPGEEQNVLVTFAPGDTGAISGALTIESDDPDQPAVTILLEGEGVAPPDISVSPDSLIDTLSIGQTSTQSLRISNGGLSNLIFRISIEQTDTTCSSVEVNSVKRNPGNHRLRPGSAADEPDGVAVERNRTRRSDILGSRNKRFAFPMYVVDSGDIVGSIPLPAGVNENGMTWGQSSIWVTDFDSHQILQIDAGDGTIVSSIPAPGANAPSELAWDGVHLWHTDFGTDFIYELDPGDGRVLSSFQVPESGEGLTWHGEFLWYSGFSFFYKLDPDGNIVGQVANNSEFADGLVWIWGTLWAATNGAIAQIDPSTGDVLNFVGFDFFHTNGLAFDGQYLLVADNSAGVIYEVDVGAGVDWLSTNPTSGSVPADSSVDITIIFDASDMHSGYYDANIVISSNDPIKPEVIVPVYLIVGLTGIEEFVIERVPKTHALSQNYPNPVKTGGTVIRYQLPNTARTTLKVYNITGQMVRTLVDRMEDPGYYAVQWDRKDDAGVEVVGGVYFYRLFVMGKPEFQSTKKMILLR